MVQYQVKAIYKEVELKMDHILQKYYKFAKLWSPNSKKLVRHVLQDYKIKLKPKTTPKFYLIYKLMEIENLVL